jgi:mRNA deadenylase 3'-5' endonuclease subunit Ccr4
VTKNELSDNFVDFSFRLDREKLPKRLWSMTNYENHLTTSHHEHFLFRLISYNILAQRLIEDNPFLYENCHEHHLFWNRRRDRLINEILNQNADVTKTKQ